MGRAFQTSTPKRRQASISTSASYLTGVKTKCGTKQRDKAEYLPFYNVQRTKLSARYPFLPNKQIERRIKHLWAKASAERRTAFCASLSGTTPVKSFRGAILKGLCRTTRNSADLREGDDRLGCETPSLVSSPRVTPLTHKKPTSVSNGILRSSEKRHTSMGRVSFRLENDGMPSPVPANHQTKQSLISGYFKHNDANAVITRDPHARVDGNKNKGKEENKRIRYEQRQHILFAKTGMQTMADKSSIGDVNMAHSSKGMDKMEEHEVILGENSEKCSTGLMDLHSAERVSNIPTRHSHRAAAIAASAKIMRTSIAECEKRSERTTMTKCDLNFEFQDTNIHHRLKKMELSWEEKRMYEFEDDANLVHGSLERQVERKPAMTTKTTPQKSVTRNVQGCNVDSLGNKLMFDRDSPSLSMTPRVSNVPPSLRKSLCKNIQSKQDRKPTVKKRGRPQKTNRIDGHKTSALSGIHQSRGKGRGPNKALESIPLNPREKNNSLPLKDNFPHEKSKIYAGEEHIPWMVSAHPSSSSDEVSDECGDEVQGDCDDEDGDAAVYQHYQRGSEGSSTSPPSPESQDLVSNSQKVCQGFETFCRNSFCSTKELVEHHVPSLESLLPVSPPSDVLSPSPSVYAPQVPCSQDDMVCAFPSYRLTTPLDCMRDAKPRLLSRKQMMRLETGEFSESSQASEDEELDSPVQTARNEERYKQARKRKEEGQCGVSRRQVGSIRNPMGADQDRKKERLTSLSSEGAFSTEKLDEINVLGRSTCSPDDLSPIEGKENQPEVDQSVVCSEVEETRPGGDGILCDLFKPCQPQDLCRLLNPSTEQALPFEDPVSTHLFLEENFFA